MCYVSIESWFGRLGNNIYQIKNAIFIMEKLNASYVLFPEHPMFNTKKILNIGSTVKNITCNCDTPITEPRNNFFYVNLYDKNMELSEDEEIDILKRYQIHQYINIKKPNKVYDVGIHLRGGDFVDVGYGFVAPLSFLKYYIDKFIKENKTIIVVYQDHKNPNVNELKKLYNDCVKFQSSSIVDDFTTLLYCKTLITGVGQSYFINEAKKISSYSLNICKHQIFPKKDTSSEFYDYEKSYDNHGIKITEMFLSRRYGREYKWRKQRWKRWIILSYELKFK